MIKLYFSPGSCSLASYIALEEAGAEYSAARIDFAADQQKSPDYHGDQSERAGTGDGHRSRCVDRDAGDPGIHCAKLSEGQAGATRRSPMRSRKCKPSTAISALPVHVAHAHKGRGTRWADDPAAIAEMKRKVPESIERLPSIWSRKVWTGRGRWATASPSVTLISFTLSGWMEGDGLDLSRYPKVMDHRRRMLERPAVSKVVDAVAAC